MKVSVFYQLPTTPPQTAHERYRETIAQIEHADRLGFDTVWLAEGHFRPTFSVLPSPLLLAAALAPLTSRIRLGTAAIQLPLHHPIRIAEEAAMVDVLSGGRLEFGVGRGGSTLNAKVFGQDWAARDTRFLEQLAVIRRAWTDGAITYQGEHFQFDGLAVWPPPLQRPCPPISITANHPDMATFTGAEGYQMLMGVAIHHFPTDFATHVQRYRHAFQPSPIGHAQSSVGAVFWGFVGHDLASVERLVMPSFVNNHLAKDKTFAEIARAFGIFGSPAECRARIEAIQSLAPLDEIILHFNPGGLIAHQQVMAAMTLFMDQVRPALP